jgi:uncharacterized lipoprotein YmbA
MKLRAFRPLALAALAAGLAACGSTPPTRFHTLLAPAPASAAAPAERVAWELLPVGVPAQVDQPQFVLRAADGTLALLENERWIAPLADELHTALVDALSRRLGPPQPTAAKPWRVRVDVQRFDSGPGPRVRDDIDWAIVGSGAAAALQCRGVFTASVGDGVPALAAGHREAVARLADAIAGAVEALAAGRPAACPSS